MSVFSPWTTSDLLQKYIVHEQQPADFFNDGISRSFLATPRCATNDNSDTQQQQQQQQPVVIRTFCNPALQKSDRVQDARFGGVKVTNTPARSQFLNDAALQELDLSNRESFIARIFEAHDCVSDPAFHIVSEFVPGPSLRGAIAASTAAAAAAAGNQHNGLPERTVQRYMFNLLTAVDVIHRRGSTFHGSLSVDTVVVDRRTDELIVLDLGFAAKMAAVADPVASASRVDVEERQKADVRSCISILVSMLHGLERDEKTNTLPLMMQVLKEKLDGAPVFDPTRPVTAHNLLSVPWIAEGREKPPVRDEVAVENEAEEDTALAAAETQQEEICSESVPEEKQPADDEAPQEEAGAFVSRQVEEEEEGGKLIRPPMDDQTVAASAVWIGECFDTTTNASSAAPNLFAFSQFRTDDQQQQQQQQQLIPSEDHIFFLRLSLLRDGGALLETIPVHSEQRAHQVGNARVVLSGSYENIRHISGDEPQDQQQQQQQQNDEVDGIDTHSQEIRIEFFEISTVLSVGRGLRTKLKPAQGHDAFWGGSESGGPRSFLAIDGWIFKQQQPCLPAAGAQQQGRDQMTETGLSVPVVPDGSSGVPSFYLIKPDELRLLLENCSSAQLKMQLGTSILSRAYDQHQSEEDEKEEERNKDEEMVSTGNDEKPAENGTFE